MESNASSRSLTKVDAMRHRNCNGRIVEKNSPPDQKTIKLECLKCGKVWGVLSDLSDIESPDVRRQKPDNLSFFEFEKFRMPAHLPVSIINYVFNDRLRRLAKMVDFRRRGKHVGLDIGCGAGYFTRYLAERHGGIVVGMDVYMKSLSRAKIRTRLNACSEKPLTGGTLDFVCSTITHLPFRKDAIDLVFCASVLEHIKDLDVALGEIKFSMSKKGILIAGYPIEGSLFMTLLRLFLPTGLYIRDPRMMGRERFEKDPGTHKQKFANIRTLLQKHFVRVNREKLFFTFLPDQISWYECVRMSKRSG